MRRGLRRVYGYIGGLLERFGIIDQKHLGPTMSLSWPRIISGFAIKSKQTADLAMVGLSVGATGTAGLAFAFAYFDLAISIGLGFAGGTVSLVSQNYGGGDNNRATIVAKQGIIVASATALPIIIAYTVFTQPLIGFLGSEPSSIRHGMTYLLIASPAILFEFMNHVASRVYAGIGDTYTPMIARGGGAILNIGISGALIFGAGMGVAGAAIGTTVATFLVTLVFAWGMFGREYGVFRMKTSPVPITVSGPWFDKEITGQLLEISTPLIARRMARQFVVFPFLLIAAAFGPLIVTSLEVGRRVRGTINSVRWGFMTASSALVGQKLGAGDETEAENFGVGIIKLSTLIYIVVATITAVLARPIATLFVATPAEVDQAAVFIAVGAVSAIGLGIDGASTGALRGAGDTRWPFISSIIGRYVFALPAAALGLVTPLGIIGLYLALLLETYVPAIINTYLFTTGRWKEVSRKYRPSSRPG